MSFLRSNTGNPNTRPQDSPDGDFGRPTGGMCAAPRQRPSIKPVLSLSKVESGPFRACLQFRSLPQTRRNPIRRNLGYCYEKNSFSDDVCIVIHCPGLGQFLCKELHRACKYHRRYSRPQRHGFQLQVHCKSLFMGVYRNRCRRIYSIQNNG